MPSFRSYSSFITVPGTAFSAARRASERDKVDPESFAFELFEFELLFALESSLLRPRRRFLLSF